MVLLFVVGVMVFAGDDESAVENFGEEQQLPQHALFKGLATEIILSGEIDGVAISVIERDGTTYNLGGGSLTDSEIADVTELSPLSYIQQLLSDVERGVLTLDEAVDSVCMEVDYPKFSLHDASRYAIMLLNEGSIGDERLLSGAAIRELLTPNFGWYSPQYLSLLSAQTMEFCAQSCAMIVDREVGRAVVIVVDSKKPLDEASFAAIRSKVASMVAAMESFR